MNKYSLLLLAGLFLTACGPSIPQATAEWDFPDKGYGFNVDHQAHFEPGEKDFSFSCWYQTDDRTHAQAIVQKNGPDGIVWGLHKQDVYLKWFWEDTNKQKTELLAITTDRSWHLVIGILDRQNKTARLFVDNQEVARTDLKEGIRLAGEGSLGIGQMVSEGRPFYGALRHLRFYDKALDSTELGQLWANVPQGLEVGKVSPLACDFEIPMLDISEQTQRHSIVDREEGVYFGHPTTVKLKTEDGQEKVMAVYPMGAHAKGTTTLRQSLDGGKSWSERISGATELGRVEEVPTIHRVLDPAGKERLILFTGLYPSRMAYSEDQGINWQPYAELGDWGGIVVMGDLIPIKKQASDSDFWPGHYMAFFHDDGRFIKGSMQTYKDPARFRLYKTLSSDGGLSWSEPEMIRETEGIHICEPGIIRSPDGKQLAMLLRENHRVANSQLMISNDEGQTWSDPIALPRSLTGDRHVLRYAPDGRVVAVFRDRQKRDAPSCTGGDYVAWIGTYDDIVNLKPGQYRVRLLNNYNGYDCGYSGLELLEDGTFLATTYLRYKPEDSGNSVVSVRFMLSELDALSP